VARTDTGLRWTAVTIDDASNAKDALDRITIPQDVLDRIAPTALPRSSIIVSDEPLSEETNYRTEFVAVLNNHPQGGFVTRERTTDDLVVSNDSWVDERFDFFQRGSRSQAGNSQPRNWDSQRSWGYQTGPQRGWGSQPGNPYYRRDQQGW
jgi:hypothetical protein